MKIKLAQGLDVLLDLNGNDTIKGLLNEKVNSKPKYWLNKLNKELSREGEEFENLRSELVKKLGEEKDGSYQIKYKLDDGSINPNLELFNKEITELLNMEIEIKDYEFKIEDFNFESESNYQFFYDLMIDDTV
jgi:hypothetical protein